MYIILKWEKEKNQKKTREREGEKEKKTLQANFLDVVVAETTEIPGRARKSNSSESGKAAVLRRRKRVEWCAFHSEWWSTMSHFALIFQKKTTRRARREKSPLSSGENIGLLNIKYLGKTWKKNCEIFASRYFGHVWDTIFFRVMLFAITKKKRRNSAAASRVISRDRILSPPHIRVTMYNILVVRFQKRNQGDLRHIARSRAEPDDNTRGNS